MFPTDIYIYGLGRSRATSQSWWVASQISGPYSSKTYRTVLYWVGPVIHLVLASLVSFDRGVPLLHEILSCRCQGLKIWAMLLSFCGKWIKCSAFLGKHQELVWKANDLVLINPISLHWSTWIVLMVLLKSAFTNTFVPWSRIAASSFSTVYVISAGILSTYVIGCNLHFPRNRLHLLSSSGFLAIQTTLVWFAGSNLQVFHIVELKDNTYMLSLLSGRLQHISSLDTCKVHDADTF